MADQRPEYAAAVNEAWAAVRKGMRKAPTAEHRDMWKAMLERLACTEAVEEPTK